MFKVTTELSVESENSKKPTKIAGCSGSSTENNNHEVKIVQRQSGACDTAKTAKLDFFTDKPAQITEKIKPIPERQLRPHKFQKN